MSASVVHKPENNRFEIYLEDERVGLMDYEQVDSEIRLTHTEYDPAHQGKNYAAILMRDALKDVEEKKKYYGVMEQESNDRHRGWFRTMSEINRQRMTSFGRSIPPPPPISRITQAQSERETAIRSAIERIEPPNRRYNNKDFKFFRG